MPTHRPLARALTILALLAVGACDSGSPPLPTPTLRPTPRESPAGDRKVVDAFTSALGDLQPGFHVTVAIDFTGAQNGLVRLDLQARAEDYAGSFHAEIPGEALDLEVIFLDGVAYARRGTEAWRIVEGYHDTQPMNPFHRLDPSTLEDMGTIDLPGGTLHDLRTTAWIGEEPDRSVVPDATIHEPVFHVYVQDDGMPVEAQLTFTVTGTAEDRPFELDYLVSYGFTELGTPVTIEAPPVP